MVLPVMPFSYLKDPELITCLFELLLSFISLLNSSI